MRDYPLCGERYALTRDTTTGDGRSYSKGSVGVCKTTGVLSGCPHLEMEDPPGGLYIVHDHIELAPPLEMATGGGP